MPDTVVTETTPTSEQTPVITQGNPDAEAARRALYEKHYGTPGGASTSEQVVSSPDSASTAQVDHTSATPDPVPQAPEAPPAWAIEAMGAIQQELAALKAGQATTAATSTPSGTVATPPAAEAPWVAKLREGDIPGAEAALADAVAKRVKDQMEGSVIQQAETRTIERMRAMNEIESFVKDVRNANQDIIELEGMITLEAQQRLTKIQQSGSIKTTEDAVREYKKAVLEATDSARKVAQKLRGSGKTEAQVRQREVLSASTLTPSGVDTGRTQAQGEKTEPAPESLEAYFERRKSAETSRRGLAV